MNTVDRGRKEKFIGEIKNRSGGRGVVGNGRGKRLSLDPNFFIFPRCAAAPNPPTRRIGIGQIRSSN